MSTLKRFSLALLVSICALTTLVSPPASAESFTYDCGSYGYGWYSTSWGSDWGPSLQIPFNLSTGESTVSNVSLRLSGRLTDGNTVVQGADTHYYSANFSYDYYSVQYRYGYITYGFTQNTLCVTWRYYSYNWGYQATTLRIARASSGAILGSVDGFNNHYTGNSYPSVNGQRFDSNFSLSAGRFYPYSAVPASIDHGSTTSNVVTLGYTLQSDNQGNAATDYDLQYRKVGGDWQEYPHIASADGSATVSNLDYVSNYEFRIASVTATGFGPWSDIFAISTTARPASAPTITDFITSSKSVELKIQNPSIVGDLSLSDYEYSIDDGSSWLSFKTAVGPFVISGLTNNTTYPIRVRAINTAGPGDPSDSISAIPTRLVPVTPQVRLASVGNGTATLSIDLPLDETAKSISGYQYNVNNGLAWKPCVLVDRSCAISGLINGTRSKLRIRAVNSNGYGVGSAVIEAITRTTPQAPIIKSILPRVRSLTINYQAPSDNGGNVPSQYEYSIDGGLTWTASTARVSGPIVVSGLANATSYAVSVRAINDAGTGLPAQIVNTQTPAVAPNRPTIQGLVASQTSLSFSFLPPSDDGGSPITGYAFSLDSGRTWTSIPVPADSRVVISNLAPNKLFGFRLLAVNSVGKGLPSITEAARTLH